MRAHRIGLVVPFPDDRVPAEGLAMYPGVEFVPRGTGVRSLTPAGYDAAVDKILPAALELAAEGVEAVMVIGTSLTFYRGPEAHAELLARLRAETGLPCSTMSQAVVDGLHHLGAHRIAVATAYDGVVNDRLRELLEWHGFEVGALRAFGITEFGDGVIRKTEDEIIDLTIGAIEAARGGGQVDAALISCGGLQTIGCAVAIESATGVPIVTSTQSAFWAAMRLVGETGALPALGRMLAA